LQRMAEPHFVVQPVVIDAARHRLPADERGAVVVDAAEVILAAPGERPARRLLLGPAQPEADQRPGFGHADAGLGPLESLVLDAARPFGMRGAGGEEEDKQGGDESPRERYMRSIIA